MTQDLAHLTSRILAFRDARNWRPFHTPKDLALALNIEAGELAELFLWKTETEATGMAADLAGRTAIADELADVAIYALLLAHHYGINLGEAVVDKIGNSDVKYPVERARGNARNLAAWASSVSRPRRGLPAPHRGRQTSSRLCHQTARGDHKRSRTGCSLLACAPRPCDQNHRTGPDSRAI